MHTTNTACNISNAYTFTFNAPEIVIYHGISQTRNPRAERVFYKTRPELTLSFDLEDGFEEWTRKRGIPTFIAKAATEQDINGARYTALLTD